MFILVSVLTCSCFFLSFPSAFLSPSFPFFLPFHCLCSFVIHPFFLPSFFFFRFPSFLPSICPSFYHSSTHPLLLLPTDQFFNPLSFLCSFPSILPLVNLWILYFKINMDG
ncbi:hypothetical protein ILYODFUR_024373 [Ilyodon furcidens]|uniref:Uncharacterized protein n=1 Tax=Ilyodon furcidens TaxID=33524 RepID=A0ABV0UX08_9TELE